MQQRYRSDGPNHVHQLMVAPSRHYYLGKDGLLKYQSKPFTLVLADMPQAKRHHMVTYTLRDHWSTLLYAQVCFAPALMPLRTFLARAWGGKSNTPFRGVPELLITSRATLEVFPDDMAAVSALGVKIRPATSGFQSGIHGALAVERWLAFFVDKPVDDGLASLNRLCEMDGREKMPRAKKTKIEMWANAVGQVRELPPGWG